MRITMDTAGNLYVNEAPDANTPMALYVTEISPAGASYTVTHIAGNGTQGYNGDNILATQAQLNQNTGLAWNSSGGVYIADAGNLRVRELQGFQGGLSIAYAQQSQQLVDYLGYQQYAINPLNDDFFYVEGSQVWVLGYRVYPQSEVLENIIAAGAPGAAEPPRLRSSWIPRTTCCMPTTLPTATFMSLMEAHSE